MDFGGLVGAECGLLPGELVVVAVAAVGGGTFEGGDGRGLGGVEVADGGGDAVAGEGAVGAAENPFGERVGEVFGHGDFDVGGGVLVGAEEDFDVVFDVAGGGDLLEVAKDLGDAAGEEVDGEVDVVSAGVVEEAAAEFGEGLPVVATVEGGGVVAEVEEAAEEIGGEDLLEVEEFGAETVGLIDEEFFAGLLGGGEHLIGLGDGHGHGFFDDDVFAGAEGGDGFVGVVEGRGGKDDDVDVGESEDFVERCGGTAVKFGGGLVDAVGDGVGDSGDLRIRTGAEHFGVDVPAGAAEADDGELEGLGHGENVTGEGEDCITRVGWGSAI